jgi:hypothetical protein
LGLGAGAGAGVAAALPRILNITVPQVGHLPLMAFAAIFHGFFNAIGDGLFGLALDAVSFRHKKIAADASCTERSEQAT